MTELSHTQYESKFRAFGLNFTLEEDVPLDSIKLLESAQVRSASELAPQDQVNLYAIQMAAGEVFPPVVTWRGHLIDGNTRLRAHRKAGHASTSVYRVECRNERQAKQLAAALNQTNGRRLKPDEARVQAVAMMDDGYSDAFVARELGVEPSKVRRWRKEQEASDHATRLGIEEEFDSISATNRARLSEIAHDEPFKAMVRALTANDIPSPRDFAELLDDVKSASSDEAAVETVQTRVENWEPKGTRQRGRGATVPARSAYKSIGALLAHDVHYWVDFTEQGVALPKWQQLADLANAVVAAYTAHDSSIAA